VETVVNQFHADNLAAKHSQKHRPVNEAHTHTHTFNGQDNLGKLAPER